MIIVSAIAHFVELAIAFSFFNDIFSAKRNKFLVFFAGCGLYAVVFTLYLTVESTIVNIASALIFYVIYSLLFFECGIKKSIFSALFLSVSLTASEFLLMAMVSPFQGGNMEVFKASAYNFMLMAMLSRLIYFVITKSVVYFGIYFKEKKVVRFPLFLFLYPIVTIIILYIFWTISAQYRLSEAVSITVSVASAATFLSVFLTYVFYGKASRELDELYKQKIEADRQKLDREYYSILDRQNERLKSLIHDEKKHLSVIKSLPDAQEKDTYIDAVFKEIKSYSVVGNTKNRILDLIINKYSLICQTEGIDFNAVTPSSNLSQIPDADLITILGNILDNAVEAAKTSAEKKIELTIKKENVFDVLFCSNSCDDKPRTSGENLLSTKQDTTLHGAGVKNIVRAVEKNDGDFSWKYDTASRRFVVSILFNE